MSRPKASENRTEIDGECHHRREFLKSGAAMGAGLLAGGFCLCGCNAQQKKNAEAPEKPLDATAYCGLICTKCPAYIARKTNDDRLRAKMLQIWSAQYAVTKIEDINCDGCHTETGVLFKHCANCPIRTCAIIQGLANCAYCPAYPCERINRFPFGRKRLDRIRRQAGLS